MLRLAERQQEFAAALLDPERPAPFGLVGPDGEPSARRFAVYRNNVVAGLVETLQATFPAICRIVGKAFFQAMARTYVLAEPPGSPILLDYGAGFPDFIGDFVPAATLPYLSDVARIEYFWAQAYHAAEASPLDPLVLAAIAPEALPEICLLPHPSVHLVRSQFPALTIWRMNMPGGVPAPVDFALGEDVLIVRPAAEVEVRLLASGGLDFLQALADGMPVLAALKIAMAAGHGFDLTVNLEELMRTGVFVGYSPSTNTTLQKLAGQS
jgi:hypothetical protein